MKNILIALVLILCSGVVATAQTCTPVKLSKSYTTRDDGTGPYMEFIVDGHTYSQEATITLPATSLITNQTIYYGWVDVFAGFGGCTQSWSINGFNYYYGLYDLNEGRWVFDSPEQSPIENVFCGAVSACRFNNTGNTFSMNVVPGHRYHLWGFVSMGTSVGTSNWYSDYLTITIQ